MIGSSSKNDLNLEYLYSRLDEVRLTGHERLRAKARLAQADAIAGVLVDMANGTRSLLKTLVLRPIRRLTTASG